jgi:hypothetical protein
LNLIFLIIYLNISFFLKTIYGSQLRKMESKVIRIKTKRESMFLKNNINNDIINEKDRSERYLVEFNFKANNICKIKYKYCKSIFKKVKEIICIKSRFNILGYKILKIIMIIVKILLYNIVFFVNEIITDFGNFFSLFLMHLFVKSCDIV